MAENSTLFLICSERSGSNLIRVMMDAHPDIIAPPPMHLMRDVVARVDALTNIESSAEVSKVMLRLLQKKLDQYFPKDQSKALFNRVEKLTPFTTQKLLKEVYDGVSEQADAKLLMIKENELHRSIFQLVDAFPNARFVFQVRDPRDYYASAVALRNNYFGNKFGSFRNAMQVWEDDQRLGLRLLGYFGPERVFFQRYEDLISNPELVLRQLCKFSGINFSPEMLNFHEDEGVQKLSKDKKAWENLSSPVISGNSKKYLNVLSKSQIFAIEAFLGPLMRRFGYSLENAEAPTSRWPVIWASLTEPLERYFNKIWSPFYVLQNIKHHEKLDRLALPIFPSYGNNLNDRVAICRQPTVVERLLEVAHLRPDNIAMIVDGQEWSYTQLINSAMFLAKQLDGEKLIVGIYTNRRAFSYIAILAVVFAGGTYVPLNCRYSIERNRHILRRSGATVLLHGDELTDIATDIVSGTVVSLMTNDLEAENSTKTSWNFKLPALEDKAYIMFTSGSTGNPKGVSITHGNLAAYINCALAKLRPTINDRFSQTFDLTFDLSVHDLFVCWSSGATLCVASQIDLIDAESYIQKNSITQWFCVPSLAYTMRLSGKLNAGAYPSIRKSLFCGEALPAEVAQAWQLAAPESIVENWYGPTEATISCLGYVLTDKDKEGIIPIGQPFDGVTSLIIGKDGKELGEGKIGILHIGGAQVAEGYYSDEEKTAASFVHLNGYKERFYCTGDLVSREGECFFFHGREDLQVKIRGYRVEIGEVETTLRQQFPGCNVAAFAWPPDTINATHIVAAIETDVNMPKVNRNKLSKTLPDYSVPSSTFELHSFPKNTSGKTDRKAIIRALQKRIAAKNNIDANSYEERILSTILAIKPSLEINSIYTAENLLEAGLDSLDFVRLTLQFEEAFGVSLTESSVARMADLPFSKLCSLVERGYEFNEAIRSIPQQRIARKNRAITFLNNFPAVITKSQLPLILTFGSSGTMRGIDTHVAEVVAHQFGCRVKVLNVGLPALTSKGLARMSQFIVDTCKDASVFAVLHELDPMILSTLPPKGDIELEEALYSVAGSFKHAQNVSNELDWSIENGGMLAINQATKKNHKRALWERKRDREIADVYNGKVLFDDESVAAWITASRWLIKLEAPCLSWVHPLAEGSSGGGHFDEMIHSIEAEFGTHILPPSTFNIESDLFLNLNHVAPGAGMEILTNILMSRLLKMV